MNEEKFLKEIKELINQYERDVQGKDEMPYASIIESNKNKKYRGDLERSIDEEIEELVLSRMEGLKKEREKHISEEKEEIYTKTQEFVDSKKKEIDEQIEEKSKQAEEQKKELEKYFDEIVELDKDKKALSQVKTIMKDMGDMKTYQALDEAEKTKIQKLKQKSKEYAQMQKDDEELKSQIKKLEEQRDSIDKTYGGIDFTSESVIDDIKNIINQKNLEEPIKSEAEPKTEPEAETKPKTPKTETKPKAEPEAETKPKAPKTETKPKAPKTETKPKAEPTRPETNDEETIDMKEVERKLRTLYAKDREGCGYELPPLYDDYVENFINEMMETYKDPIQAKNFLTDYPKFYENAGIENVLEDCKYIINMIQDDYVYYKQNGKIATEEEIKEVRDFIEVIEKELEEKGANPEPPQQEPPQQEPQPFEETKIVVEPYNNRIMVYLKGEIKERPYDDIALLIEDGKNLFKSDPNIKGSYKGIKKGDFAILAVLSKLAREKEIENEMEKEDYIEGYSYMLSKDPKVDSKIDSIVYDFRNEAGKKQDEDVIKKVEKYAKNAEKYGVAESIGREKRILEKGKDLLNRGKDNVLELGEKIKNFHPIKNTIENKRANKHKKDLYVDEEKASKAYKEFRDSIHFDVDEPIFKDRSDEETKKGKVKEDEIFKEIYKMGRSMGR